MVTSSIYTQGSVGNLNRGMAQHPHLTLPNDPYKDIWSYYELLQVSPIVFNDHIVVILEVPVVDKYVVINDYKTYNFPILHPVPQEAFQYFVEEEYLAIPFMMIMPLYSHKMTF